MPNTKCSNCQHWTRCETYPNPEADATANIGTCAHIITDTEPIESDKPKKGSAHAPKALFAHENFACMYFTSKK